MSTPFYDTDLTDAAWALVAPVLLGGLSALFPRIRTVIADAGHQSRKLTRTLKQDQGWQLRIVKRRQRAFKITGLTWIVERSFAWLGRNRRLSKDLRISGANLRDDDRPCLNPPYAKPDSPCVRLFKHPLRATGITNFLENGGTLEVAQRIAGHADSRTTKLYDRRGQKVLLEDMERFVISVELRREDTKCP
jgi:transposase